MIDMKDERFQLLPPLVDFRDPHQKKPKGYKEKGPPRVKLLKRREKRIT